MRSLILVSFALFSTFKSTDSQYNWNPFNSGGFGFNNNQQNLSSAYYPQQSLGSYYQQPSNSFFPSPSYRFYPQQQIQNSFYAQPSYLSNQHQQSSYLSNQHPQPSNANDQQPNSYNTRLPQYVPTELNTAQRLSERKCEEYLKMSQINVSVSALTLRPAYNNILIDNCEASQGLIINGENAKAGEFPSLVAVGYRNKNQIAKFICGGSLISDQFVLTAAHCRIHEGKPSSIVRLGDLNLKVKEQGSSEIDIAIESFINHENYDPSRKKNDIAVIKLVSKVTLSKLIRPACLMTPNNHINVENAVVIGWGLTEAFTAHTSDILQKATLAIKSIRTCRNFLNDQNIDSSQICAGDSK